MLPMYKRIIKMVRDGIDGVLSEIARGKEEIREALGSVVPDIQEEYRLDAVPADQISSDATVRLPAAASKKVDVSKLKGKKLRAYADTLGVEYHHRLGDEKLRAKLGGE